MTTRDYNLALVQLTLDSVRLTGWGADDAISIAPGGDLFEYEEDADGSGGTFSRVNSNRRDVVLKLRRGTAAFRLVGEMLQAQVAEADVGAVTARAFRFYDPISGDKVVARDFRFMAAPEMGAGKKAPTVDIKITLASAQETYAPNVSVSV